MGKYVQEERVQELHHPYNTQKNESAMDTVCRYLCKGTHLGSTSAANAQINTAIISQSVGMCVFYLALFSRLGMAMTGNTERHFKRIDVLCHKKRQYNELESTKK